MSPSTRFVVRAVFVGVLAAAASLQASSSGVDWNDALQALIAGVVAVGAYLGIGAATPLEPDVGRRPGK